jgi:hypothetical protein
MYFKSILKKGQLNHQKIAVLILLSCCHTATHCRQTHSCCLGNKRQLAFGADPRPGIHYILVSGVC